MSESKVQFDSNKSSVSRKVHLDPSAFQFVDSGTSSVKGNQMQFEVFRPVGDPMILIGSDQRPIASLHFRGAEKKSSSSSTKSTSQESDKASLPASTIYFRKSEQPEEGCTATISYFNGLINRAGAFELVLTNLIQTGHIVFHVLKDQSSKQINDINCLPPLRSVVIKQDATTNFSQLILEGETKQIMEDENPLPKDVPMTISENEELKQSNLQKAKKGVVFSLVVQPEKKLKMEPVFQGARWVSAEQMPYFAYFSEIVAAVNHDYHKNEYACRERRNRNRTKSEEIDLTQIVQQGLWDSEELQLAIETNVVRETMRKNVNQILQQTEKLEDMEDKSQDLSQVQESFRSNSRGGFFSNLGRSIREAFRSSNTNTNHRMSNPMIHHEESVISNRNQANLTNRVSSQSSAHLFTQSVGLGLSQPSESTHHTRENIILGSQVGRLAQGERIESYAQVVEIEMDDAVVSPIVRLELSIAPKLCQVQQQCCEQAVSSEEYRSIIQSLILAWQQQKLFDFFNGKSVFKSEECCVCCEPKPDVILMPCNHECLHHQKCFSDYTDSMLSSRTRKMICPICRSAVSSTLVNTE